MTSQRAQRGARWIAVSGVAGAAVVAFGSPAVAQDEGFQQPPGYEAPEPPVVDPNAPGLMLGDGATLAEPEVLDVKSVIEDLGTGETEDIAEPEETDGGEEPEPQPEPEEPEGESPSGGQREEQTSGQHKFTLQTDVIFGRDSDVITDESREALADVAAAIDEYQPTEVNIFGFTDDLGSYEHGRTLSENRARNTHEALLDLIEDPSGISFNVRGYSEDYPLYDNSTEEGRQQNRRVEISWPTGD